MYLAVPNGASGFGAEVWDRRSLSASPKAVTTVALTYLVTLVSLVGRPSWRFREDVRLRMLVVPEFFLSRPQQLRGLHHVLLILMFFKPGSHQTSKVTVFVPLTKMVLEIRNVINSIEQDYRLTKGCILLTSSERAADLPGAAPDPASGAATS